MTAQLAPVPMFRGWDNNGNPLANGQLFTYQAGTSTPQATYTDASQGTPNTNPVVLNARGEAAVWLDPTLIYKVVLQDSQGNFIWSQDQIVGGYIPVTQLASYVTQAFIGQQLYPRTAAEIAANVTPLDYSKPPGTVLRYGLNTTPGTTDMTTAFNNAALCNNGVYAPGYAGPYLVTGQIVLPDGVTLYGDGQGSVINLSSTANTDLILASNVTNVIVRDLKLVATGVTTVNNYQGVVAFRGCTNCRAQRLEITGFYTDGIVLNASVKCYVEDNYIHGSQGSLGSNADIHVNCTSGASSSDNIIANNRCFGGSNDFGIALFQVLANGQPVLRTTVSGNKVDAHGAYGILLYDNNNVKSECHCQIIGNEVQNITGASSPTAYGAGIYVQGFGSTSIVGNTIRNCCTQTTNNSLAPGGIGINLVATNAPCTITGNSIYDMAVGNANSVTIAGIYIAASGLGVTISGNTISQQQAGALQVGIFVNSGCTNVQTTGNTVNIVSSISGTRGIWYYANGAAVNGSGIDGNLVFGCSAAQIEAINNGAFNLNNITITGNKCINGASGCIGLLLANLVQGTVTGNTVNANNANALNLSASTSTRISGNSLNTSGATCVALSGTCTGSALNETNSINGTPGSIVNSSTGLLVSFYATASPASGTFAVGDMARNSSPSAAGVLFWVCTTAGTPGTFKTVSNT